MASTAAPWLDAEPILCPLCDGPCTEPPERTDDDQDDDRG